MALSAFACFAGSASWISWNTANNLALLKRWVKQQQEQQLHANKAYKVGIQLSNCMCVWVWMAATWGNISQVANCQLTTTLRATTCGQIQMKCIQSVAVATATVNATTTAAMMGATTAASGSRRVRSSIVFHVAYIPCKIKQGEVWIQKSMDLHIERVF